MSNTENIDRGSLVEPVKMSQNENPFGPSPKVIEAINNNSNNVHRYPPRVYDELKAKLANKYSLLPGNVAISSGSL